MEFITENIAIILSVLALLIAAAGQVAKLTKTPKDDEVVAKLEKLVKAGQDILDKKTEPKV